MKYKKKKTSEYEKKIPGYKTNKEFADAVQWTGDNYDEIKALIPIWFFINKAEKENQLFIITLDGRKKIKINDFLLKTNNDEYSILSQEEFEDSYEKVTM